MTTLLTFWFYLVVVYVIYDFYISPLSTIDYAKLLASQDPDVAETLNSVPYSVIVIIIIFTFFFFSWGLPFRIYLDFFKKR